MPPLDWQLIESCNRFAPATVHGTTADGDVLYLIRLGGKQPPCSCRHKAIMHASCMRKYRYTVSSVYPNLGFRMPAGLMNPKALFREVTEEQAIDMLVRGRRPTAAVQ